MPDRPLRVALDARNLNTAHVRGIGKCVYELIKRTSDSGAIEWHLFADRPDQPMQLPPGANCEATVFETRGHRFHAWEQMSLPLAARRVQADLLYAPATSAPLWQPVPTIVSVLDTIPWQKRDGADTRDVYRDYVLPAAYRRAAAITTISQTSRRDILARWPSLQQKLSVIALGVDERYLDCQPDRRPIEIGGKVIPEPYVLYVGGADPRKRLTWALQAWWSGSAARSWFVACGVEANAQAAFRASVPHDAQDRLVFSPFVSEEEMPRVYMHAAMVLYPSLYEGFGLPVVEAQAVGTPVMFSEVGSLSELTGPGAVVLPVDDLTAWTRMIATFLDKGTGRFEHDRIARAWARQFSWDAFVDRTLTVFESVVHPASVARSNGGDLREEPTR